MHNSAEYLIARRTASSQKSGGVGVMTPIATFAVALSIAVMIITLAVVSGFRREINTKLTSLAGHVTVSHIGALSASSPMAIDRYDAGYASMLDEMGVDYEMSPFALRGGVIKSDSSVEGVVVKGVDSLFDRERLAGGLISGEIDRWGEGERASRNIVISSDLARETGLKVGDRTEIIVTSKEGDMRRDLYKVGGVYSLGLGESEKLMIFTDIRNIQRINEWDTTQVSGYDIWLPSVDKAPEVAELLNDAMFMAESSAMNGAGASSIQSLYPAIFDWLVAHDINAAVVISIMMIVSIFNIITTMLILVLERTQLIGILKTLGMKSSAIGRIFIIRALSITLHGLACGSGIALLLCWLQSKFHIIKLDESGYMVSSVPIEIEWWWVVALNVGVVAVVLLVVIMPTRMVSRIEPSESIKYQ